MPEGHLVNPTTIATFRSRVEAIEWSQVLISDSTNDSYDTFSSLLMSAYHKSFPLKTLSLSFKTQVYKRSLCIL